MQEHILHELSHIFLSASDRHELEVLLQGLLTPRELEEIIRRWHLMSMLESGKPQRDIAHELGISLGKIARGSRLLKYGPPEFKELSSRIRRLKNEEDS
jgi:TrpR family trp operon transcriptional repressor